MRINQVFQANTFSLSLLYHWKKKRMVSLKLLQLRNVMMLTLIISPRLLHMIEVMYLLLVHLLLLVFKIHYFSLLKPHKYNVILHHLLNLNNILFNKFFSHGHLFKGRNHKHASFLLYSKISRRKLFIHWSLWYN